MGRPRDASVKRPFCVSCGQNRESLFPTWEAWHHSKRFLYAWGAMPNICRNLLVK